MIKEEVIARLKVEMEKPCSLCVDEVFKYLMDPQTQGLMHSWVIKRKGLLQFHVHAPGVLDTPGDGPVMLFRTLVYVNAECAMLHWTPSSRTVEGAIKFLEYTLLQEEQRLKHPRINELPR